MERKEIHIEWLTKNFYCTLLVLDFRYENLQWRAFWAENYTIIQYSDLWKETIFQRRELGIQKLTMMLWKKKIHEISRNCPNSGILEIVSHLSTANYPLIIQRNRIRKSLPEIDSVGSCRRWTQVVRRRTYRVLTSNSLWHIDTNHKLIR